MPSPTDPLDGASLVNPSRRFSPECLAAMRAFRDGKPWRGTPEERQAKFHTLHAGLCEAYGLRPAPELVFHQIGEPAPDGHGDGGFLPPLNKIALVGKLSVATYLWSIARARGLGRVEAFAWSLSLFARMFPRSFARCRFDGPFLVNDRREQDC